MYRCDLDGADLVLDGVPWRCETLREAAQQYVRLARHPRVHWPDFQATIRRLQHEATAAEQQWWAVYSHRFPRLLLAIGRRVPGFEDTWLRWSQRAVETLRLPAEDEA